MSDIAGTDTSGWVPAWLRRLLTFWRAGRRRRLRNAIDVFTQEERDLIAIGSEKPVEALLQHANAALEYGDPDRGWLFFKAARRQTVYSMTALQLEREASAIRAEASDGTKGTPAWRLQAIVDQLAALAEKPAEEPAGKSVDEPANKLADGPAEEPAATSAGTSADARTDKRAEPEKARAVIRARQILDEHQDNVYQRLYILRARLGWLNLLCAVALVLWAWWPPLLPPADFLPPLEIAEAAGLRDEQAFWLAVMMSGFLGALVSGFVSSMTKDPRTARIPGELAITTLTFARLFVGTASAIAIGVLVISGTFAVLEESFSVVLATAFAAGFSDRLLLRAIEANLKTS